MPKTLKAALYARVSTTGQTVENQLRELRAVATRHGWEVASTFKDQAISGAQGREKRPGLDSSCTRSPSYAGLWVTARSGGALV